MEAKWRLMAIRPGDWTNFLLIGPFHGGKSGVWNAQRRDDGATWQFVLSVDFAQGWRDLFPQWACCTEPCASESCALTKCKPFQPSWTFHLGSTSKIHFSSRHILDPLFNPYPSVICPTQWWKGKPWMELCALKKKKVNTIKQQVSRTLTNHLFPKYKYINIGWPESDSVCLHEWNWRLKGT